MNFLDTFVTPSVEISISEKSKKVSVSDEKKIWNCYMRIPLSFLILEVAITRKRSLASLTKITLRITAGQIFGWYTRYFVYEE